MNGPAPKLGWLPPLLVGASAAIASEVAVGLLLYEGPGFVRSLTTILAIEGAALAAGLWSAPRAGPDLIHRLRRRWLLCLVTFLAAAVFGTAWSVVPFLGQARWGQGVGLTVLGALPLYSAGAVIGGIATAARTDAGRRLPGPAAAAASGATLGFVLTGLLLPRAPMPGSLFILCLVMLSLGGMVFGGVLASRLQVEVLGRRSSRGGDVRVEDRRLPVDGVAARVLFEGDHLRRTIPLDGSGAPPWDVSVIRGLMPESEESWRVLLIGGGASAVPRSILREHPTGTVEVIERTGAVVELGREFMETDLAIASGERLRVEVGNFDDRVDGVGSEYDLIVVDTEALAPVGGVGGLSARTRDKLTDLVGSGGRMAWGPLPPEPGLPEVPEGYLYEKHRRNGAGREEQVLLVYRGEDQPSVSIPGFEAGIREGSAR